MELSAVSMTTEPNEPTPASQSALSNSAVAETEATDAVEPSTGDSAETEEEVVDLHRRFLWFQAMPAWLVSTLVHALILLILGLISFANPLEIVNVLTATSTGDDGPEIEELTIEEFDPGEIEEPEELTEPIEMTEPVEVVEVAMEAPVMEMSAVPLELSDFASEMAPTAATPMTTMSAMSMQPMGSRSAEMKEKLLREYGGTPSSEAAVTEALKWFSRHQFKSGQNMGAWTMQHEIVCGGTCGNGCTNPTRARQLNAATSLALLPFLGAGQTHVKGEFRDVVMMGLRFIIQNGKPGKENGIPYIDYRSGGSMYDHGLVAITLCEAYAMTGDPNLAGPAQAAINFIAVAQCSDGGWRYGKRDARGGDTSVVGWQVMALKSGNMGHLIVPPNSIQGSKLFLDKVGSDDNSIYGYASKAPNFRAATTAVGLLCRMYTGWDKNHPSIKKGVQHLAKAGVRKPDLYYNYYAAQVLRHYGGQEWDKFNTELRDWLVETQD
ncbi:MAG: hypothetical protein AAGJ83_06000, partial [Planctomycetota bacterium]